MDSSDNIPLVLAISIGGVSVKDLIAKFGSPLYIYDLDSIESQYKKLSDAFSGFKHKIHYAVKALSNTNILKFICSLGAGADTVSVEELELCLRAGFNSKDIIFTPSGPSEAAIDYAFSKNVMITVDNMQSIEYIGKAYGNKHPISIRLNPEVFAGGDDKISVAGINSKFGLAMDKFEAALQCCKQYSVQVVGLHIHTGSDIGDSVPYFKAVNRIVDLAMTLDNLQFIDLGSGFKVSYHPEDPSYKDTNIEEYASKIKPLHEKLSQKFSNSDFELKFEPGKFIVGKSGYFASTATVVKNNNGYNFVIVNSGFNHLIRPMMYDKAYHYIENISNPTGHALKYEVCGYICETDTFGADRYLSEVRPGDLIVMHNAGAYCITMASNYNSKPRPAEVSVQNGSVNLIRRRETLDDLIMCEIESMPIGKQE